MRNPLILKPVRRILILLLTVVFASIQLPRSAHGDTDTIRVGFSIVGNSTAWISELIDHAEQSAQNMEIITHQLSETDAAQQKSDAMKMLSEGIDYLVLFPYSLSICDDIYEAAHRSGIPLILVCGDNEYRDKCDIMVYVDYRAEGQLCAQALINKFGNTKRSILVITGTAGSSIENLRLEGFEDQLEQYPQLAITGRIEGGNNRVTASNAVADYLARSPENIPDAVFACNDEDGIGALNALKLAGYTPNTNTFIVSVNGTQDALKALIADEYCATVLSCKNLGQILTLLIRRYDDGYKGISYVAVPSQVYDESYDVRDLNSQLYW